MQSRAWITVALLACAAVQAADVDALKNGVVRIVSADADGAGIVVGADAETIFIVTAKHVVPAREVAVQFNAARHKSYAGRVSRTSSEVDLALVVVYMGKDDAVRRSLKPLAIRAERAPLLTVVSNIGHEPEPWAPNFGVNKLQGEQLNTISFSKLGVVQGSSGGPLFDDGDRLIGMVIEVDAARATALKLQAIVEVLRGWGVEANLLEPEDVAPARNRLQPPPSDVVIDYSSPGLTGCGIDLRIRLGDREWNPKVRRLLILVTPGQTEYELSGTINCSGSLYRVGGRGTLRIEAYDTLYLKWADQARSGDDAVVLARTK